MRSSSNLSTHSIQSVKSSILSLQSDMSRQSDMASQSDMSLHLNSHGSIAPEPMVEEVTVESVRQSLYNTLELVDKDENTNEKAILAEDLNKKRSAPVLKNDSKEHSQITSGVSSVMISGETQLVVQKKVDQSQATNVITDLGMRNIEQSSSATNSPLAAAKLTTKSIQSVKSTTLSRQSDMSRQSNMSHKSDMSRQADMSLHLNSHSSIAPEPTVDEVTVEKAPSVTIVATDRDLKQESKENKKAVAAALENESEEQCQILDDFSSAMISGEAYVVQRKGDQSQASDADAHRAF